jgi:hypothetical protein
MTETPSHDNDRLYFRGQYSGFGVDLSTSELSGLRGEDPYAVDEILLKVAHAFAANKGLKNPDDTDVVWSLKPSLARATNKVLSRISSSCGGATDTIVLQSFLVQRLRRLAEQHLPTVTLGVHRDPLFIGWLAIAQHHKLPTYFMDWTVNPLVGLYFAIDDAFGDNQPTKDGIVWAFDLVPLQARDEAHLRCFLHLDELDMDVPMDATIKRQQKAEKDTLDSLMAADRLKRPVAVIPRLSARRLDAQGARFVYWDGVDDLEDYTLSRPDVRPFRRLRKLCWIPKDSKNDIAKELANFYRIHPGTMDADLDGYSRFLRWGGL